jgi:hypothetical protein
MKCKPLPPKLPPPSCKNNAMERELVYVPEKDSDEEMEHNTNKPNNDSDKPENEKKDTGES